MDTRQDRTNLFDKLADPDTAPEFFARVADDVNWTVEGTHPLAGTYTSKDEFTAATFHRLTPIMRDGVRLQLQHLYVDGDTVIAELEATSTTLDGSAFDNHYCWVCRFASDAVGEPIIEVRAYLDSAMVAWAIDRNEGRG